MTIATIGEVELLGVGDLVVALVQREYRSEVNSTSATTNE